jgi:anti-sigma factor RsiW
MTEHEEERILDELLRTRLPAKPAPDRLKRAVAQQIARAADDAARTGSQPSLVASSRARFGRRSLVASLGAALSLAAAFALGMVVRGGGPSNALPREALNDHLRVLYAQNPIEVPNGGIHQVKPWFTGRVDLAPDITFAGDDEFPMVGGAVGYFVDRKAASFVFKRRLHTISLFVFRADGLDWPRADTLDVGTARVQATTLDGFHILFWRAQGLDHVLVSDVSRDELIRLAVKLMS